MCKKHTQRFGAALEHGEAHEREHRLWSRRDFLSASGLAGAGAFLLGSTPVRAFMPSPLLASLAAGGANDRILVLIRLDGGNDGLNTVIQRDSSDYYNLRPTLSIPDNKLWALGNEYGMPVETNALLPLWDEGMMKVIFNVGYPNPNYSHFRSSDIIMTGSDRNVVLETGWAGRFLDNEYAAFLEAPPSIPPAMQIGSSANLLFQADQANMALSISSPEEFYQIAQTGQLYETASLGNSYHEMELGYVRQMANAAFRYAETIQQAFTTGKNEVSYPNVANQLAEPMAIIARLIKGQLGTRIFLVSIADFDTHVNQLTAHLDLLKQVSDAVRAFYDDLGSGDTNMQDKVLTMTFSEFGRSIYENGSRGTDHGAGTHTLLFGGGIGNGFLGDYQDMSNPDPVGDPPFSIDFREVYASVLQDWLGNPPELVQYVLGKPTPTLPGLLPPVPPQLGDNGTCALLGHNPHPVMFGAYEIKFSITQDTAVRLDLLDQAGHVLRSLINEFMPRGSHTYLFRPAEWHIAPGNYQYRLRAAGQVFQRAIRV